VEDFRNIMLREIEDLERDITEEGYYDWKSLEESIKKHGLLKPLHVIQNQSSILKVPSFQRNHKYRIQEGHHRVYILRKLYPSNYKVKVKIDI
tara:strand:- start:215 stop:493 length:279 start_codon:yes stop_codon:yes gene_type:complete